MDRDFVIQLMSGKAKLVRVEKDYTQDKMAEILGLSKKTLVQIEKGRTLIGWTEAVALCALFRDSEVIQSVLGDEPLEVLETIAHEGIDRPRERTMGGRVWWKDVETRGQYRLQQNVFSQHYRILDEDNHRWYSSFEKEHANSRLKELSQS